MPGADGGLNHAPKSPFKTREVPVGKKDKIKTEKIVELPPQLPRVREIGKQEAKYTLPDNLQRQMEKREAFVAREQKRKRLKREGERAGYKAEEEDGSKAKIKPAPFRYKVLPPNIEPKKPKFKFLWMDTAFGRKISSRAERAKLKENYKKDHANWLREKKRRAVVREQLTKGGVASDAFRLNMKLKRQEAEAEAERIRRGGKNKSSGPWSSFILSLLALGGAAGANFGLHYGKQQYATENVSSPSNPGSESQEAPRLEGPEWSPVSFTEAFRAAQRAEAVTGVDAELIVAVMAQESGWDAEENTIGHTIGDCRLLSPQEAEQRGVPFGTGMRLSRPELIPNAINMQRDLQPFLEITSALSLDPYQTPGSCPVYDRENRRYMGYGFALGPDQVLPSSWIRMDEEIRTALGREVSNPWDIDDAAVATAIHLREDGAVQVAMTAGQARATSSYYTGASRHRSPEGQTYRRGVERLMNEQASFIAEIRKQDLQAGGAAAPADSVASREELVVPADTTSIENGDAEDENRVPTSRQGNS